MKKNISPRLLFLSIILFLFQVSAFSQHIDGIVKGKGTVLSGATVALLNDSNAIVSFVFTDNLGKFHLQIPFEKKPTRLSVSHIGFKREYISLPEVSKEITIILEEEEFELREIEVKFERLVAQNDTLTYSVAGFKQNQDRSIADVIKKMPGMDVKPDGTIEYQGKAISTFYIEGLDLLGSKYGLASNNLSVNNVESVQVLKNHQPIKALRNISFNECAALNIVLKDNAKSVWNRICDVGVGYGEKVLCDSKAMLMLFDKKFQTLMMYKYNNTGVDISKEVMELAATSEEYEKNMNNGIVSMMTVPESNIAKERHTFNNSNLFAGNWLWKTGKDSNLRLQASGLMDTEDVRIYSSTTYLTVSELPIVVEDMTIKNGRSEWKGEIDYKLNNDNTYIHQNTRGYFDFNKSIGTLLCNRVEKDMMVKPYKQYITNNLHLSHTTNNNSNYDLTSYISFYHLPEQLLAINGTQEMLDLKSLTTHNELKYRWKIGNYYVNNNVGVEYIKQNISLAGTYQLCQAYWMPSISLLRKKHKLNASVKLGYMNQSYKKNITDHVLIEPKISLTWTPTAVSEFYASTSYNNSPRPVTNLYDNPLFTDYRTKVENRGVPELMRVLSINASYKYTNPIKGMFFNFQPVLNISYGNRMYKSSLTDGLYSISATTHDYTSTTKGATARMSKAFNWAKAIMGLSALYRTRNYFFLVSDNINKANIYSFSSIFDYSMRPFHLISLEGKTALEIVKQSNTNNPHIKVGNIYNLKNDVNINLLINRRWTISISNELNNSNVAGKQTNYFCDLSINYNSKRWDITCLINNIFDSSTFEYRQIFSEIQYYNITKLRPREYLIKCCANF